MTFGTLVLTAFTRNPLRSLFTFVAIAAAFCLFGALETLLYQRSLPPADADVIIVQLDCNTMLPPDSEAVIAGIRGVRAVVGIHAFGAQHPKTPTQQLFVTAVNPPALAATLPGMEISKEVLARWGEVRNGVLVDDKTARELGWSVNDHVTLALASGFRTRSGEDTLALTVVGQYRSGSVLGGLIVRADLFGEAFPQMGGFGTLFVRPERGSEGRAVAQRIDEHFRGGAAQSLSAPISDFRESAVKDAAMLRLVMLGALVISFFTMVLIVANALMQSVRERTGEMAVMQALGFQERSILLLVLMEALALFGLGAVVGLVMANLGFTFEIAGTLRRSGTLLPAHTVLLAIGYVVLFASVAALLPCWEVSKLRVSDALRRL